MGYLGRRIGLSQDKGDSTPGGADGAVGGGILDLFAHGYFERQDKIYNAPGVPLSGMTATGGVIHDYSEPGGSIYRAHIFTSSGTFNVTAPGDFDDTLEYLVVAGGGGGGGYSGANGGGGGGAGGLRTNLSGHPKAGAAYPVPAFPTSYTVTIGAGGVHQAGAAQPGTDGSNSEFHPTPQSYPSTTFVRSIGGGGGGYDPATGRPGGSSGGGAAPTSSIVPGNPSPDPNHPQPQGNAGGHGGSNSSRAGGGGGGAGTDGGNASGSFPGGLAGYGGRALQVAIAGPPTLSAAGTPGPSGQGWYAGGGGGAGADETFADDKRGIGGRGNDRTGTTPYGGGGNGAPGGPAVPRDSMNGLSGTGGGGGGGREAVNYGGSGGSGVVVVRYQIGSVNTAKASGGAVSFYNNKTIHVFTGSGTFSSDSPFNETCECIIIGGGAGTGNPSSSGSHGGGGGGAGAVYDRNNVSLNLSGPFSFNVTIGAGGNRAVAPGNKGVNGSPSIVAFPTGTLTAPGGGAGGVSQPGTPNTDGNPGGAGGGASNYSSPNNPHPGGTGDGAPWPGTPGNDPGSGWGGDGGNSIVSSPSYGGGGGGGAVNGDPGDGTDGGNGGGGYKIPTTYTNPVATYGYAGPGSTHFWFAGGGGGGVYDGTSGSQGKGGNGPDLSTPYAGAGNGGYRATDGSGAGTSALANSGSGAGGGGGGNADPGANGGSGIVIIAYPT